MNSLVVEQSGGFAVLVLTREECQRLKGALTVAESELPRHGQESAERREQYWNLYDKLASIDRQLARAQEAHQ